jgi:hypothetical protein
MFRALSRILPSLCVILAGIVVSPAFSPRQTYAADSAPMPRDVAAKPKGTLEYNRDVRPILAENCFACHGPDSAARKAGLRIDRRDEAISMKAIVPGKPAESGMIERIFSKDADEQMPPAKTHKVLTPAQKETLKKWVAEGAEYQSHWSFIPPVRPKTPEVKDKGWVRNPIDNFILAQLEASGLKPAPEADIRTLARRLALDITGLPPDPSDVDALAAAVAAEPKKLDALYEKYVDKLMTSPHWGEHRGRYWLDYARYGDTHGIHMDNFREIWSYREWVIRAFNDNKPFDQFTTEQLAGDLLPNPTLDQLVATGFNRCNITTSEGGAINEEYLVLYARDRTETTSQVFMGLTTGCAVCHDHKFDPITQRDFYSLSAFFNNTTQNAMDGNIQNTPPVIPVPKMEDRARFGEVTKELAKVREKLAGRKTAAKPDFDKWLASATAETVLEKMPSKGLKFQAQLIEGEGTKTSVVVDGKSQEVSLGDGFAWDSGPRGGKALRVKQTGSQITVPEAGDFDRTQPFTASAWVKITRRNSTGAAFGRMDPKNKYRGWDLWIEGEKPGSHIINAYPDDALKVVSNNPLPFNQWAHVAIVYDGSAKPEGLKVFVNAVAQPTTTQNNTLKNTTRTEVPLTIGSRHNQERLFGNLIEDIRIYDRALTVPELDQLARYGSVVDAIKKPKEKRTPAEVTSTFEWWLATFDMPSRDLEASIAKLQAEEAAIKGRGTIAHVMTEKAGEPGAFILFRGDYDKRRDPVKAETPKSLPPLPTTLPKNRLGLAKWLLAKEHPLTARVTVNRFWQEIFGTGLVRTSGDFGITGELPSNPELLDWLASEFREPTCGVCCCEDVAGWDMKRFFKLMVTSSTYRQSAVATKEKVEKDRDNRLLSRGPRFRMDAEMIRDFALSTSGLLVRKIGGPSVKPYQPEGVWEAVAMIGSNTRDYRRDNGESLYRRSMYTFWKRSAPPASMEVLNAPNRETCAVRRERTNTPIQALLTLNDVQFVEAARVLAEHAMKSGKDDDARIDYIAKQLLARPFRPQEVAIVKTSLKDLRADYKSKIEEAKKLIAFGETKADATMEAPELAAWTMLVNELMNLDEALNK